MIITEENSKMIEILGYYSPAKHDCLIVESGEWKDINKACGEWLNAFSIRSAAPIAPEKVANVLQCLLQTTYVKGIERGRKERVMGMEWKVADEPPTD